MENTDIILKAGGKFCGESGSRGVIDKARMEAYDICVVMRRNGRKKMEGRRKRRIVVLLTTLLCMVLLTGCPRRMTKEEEERYLSFGRPKLTQAMKEDYQLEEGDYQILSQDIFWQSAYGYSAVKYVLEAGNKTFQVTVNLGTDEIFSDVHGEELLTKSETFSDYYGKEFEEVLTAYLDEKMESVPKMQEASKQMLSVEFGPPEATEACRGMIPTSISPEEFGAYLESCEQEHLLNVNLTIAWYSTEEEELSENLLESLRQGTDRLPSYLEVKRFACEKKEELDPTDLKEIRSYYIGKDGMYEQATITYDYFEVSENLVVRRRFSDDKARDTREGNGFGARVDKYGYLTIYPSDEHYDLFFRDGEEGTNVAYWVEDSKHVKHMYKSKMIKDLSFKHWCYVNYIKGDARISVGDYINE